MIKSQIVIDKLTDKVICTSFSKGRKHDFKLFKESKVKFHPNTQVIADTGYQGIGKIHVKVVMPKKRSKKNQLSKEDKRRNKEISRERIRIEHVIGTIKRFKIISDRYRNRRRRFGLRFNLIVAIYNLELLS